MCVREACVCEFCMWMLAWTHQEATALYPYAAQEVDELQLQAGERVFLLGLSQPEWYVAVRASVSPPEIGLIPHNYVACVAGQTDAPHEARAQKIEAGPELRDERPKQAGTESADEAAEPAAEDVETWLDTPTGPKIFSRSATYDLGGADADEESTHTDVQPAFCSPGPALAGVRFHVAVTVAPRHVRAESVVVLYTRMCPRARACPQVPCDQSRSSEVVDCGFQG